MTVIVNSPENYVFTIGPVQATDYTVALVRMDIIPNKGVKFDNDPKPSNFDPNDKVRTTDSLYFLTVSSS
ncbi:hypothetical protein FPHOBKDP_00039 [Listeria phage LPJP1]|nr:hypothetical protein FPHOBKDP_00039 [Listeria phage LPJP1]